MKKYNWYFSLWNLTDATQEQVVKLQMIWTGLSAPIIASSYITTNEKYALLAAVLCGIIDKLIGCIYLEEKK